jgi:hypothetical protein
MRKAAVGILIIFIAICSCKSKRDMLTGTWHAVKLENPEMDSFFINSQNYIDTIGKKNTDDANMQIYGVINMDSLRKVLQAQFDTAKAMQVGAVTNTVFQFRKDSLAILIFNGVVDSAVWVMDKDGRLMLDDMHRENAGEQVNMEVLKLTDMVLKLRFKEDSSFSTVTFRREGK